MQQALVRHRQTGRQTDEKAMKPRLDIHFTATQKRAFWKGTAYVPVQEEFLVNHARNGIMLALQSLRLPKGSPVGVMVYNCHTVFSAVAQAGYKPVFIDVTDALTLDLADLREKAKGLRALVVTHLFGIINDIACIREEFPDLQIIEDCAHAFGHHGADGDFCVFSIGQGKLPSLGDGGILTVQNEALLSEVERLYRDLPEYSFRENLKLYCKLSVQSLLYWPWVYSLITKPLKQWRKVSSGVETLCPSKMSPGIRAMFAVAKASFDDCIQERKLRAAQTESSLCNVPGVRRVLSGSINGFMAIAECEDPSAVKEVLRKQGLEAETHFGHCIEWAKQFGYVEGSCPQAERLTQHLLMVPTYA